MLENNREDEFNKRYDVDYDETDGGFPSTPIEKRMAFENFRSNLNQDEPDCEHVLDNVVDQYLDEMIDLRPYIWEHPFTVYTFDNFEKCLDIFRKNSLKHLYVLTPH